MAIQFGFLHFVGFWKIRLLRLARTFHLNLFFAENEEFRENLSNLTGKQTQTFSHMERSSNSLI